jgi:hypothetical protein
VLKKKKTLNHFNFFKGNQARPEIFDLKIDKPEQIYRKVIEVDERIRIVDKEEKSEQMSLFFVSFIVNKIMFF